MKPEGFIEMAVSQKFFILKYVSCPSVSLNLSVIENNGAFAEIEHHIQIMGSNYFGMLEGFKHSDKLASSLGIKTGGRFIHDQNIWRHGQDSDNCHPSFLAGGKPMGRPVFQCEDSDGFQGLFDPGMDLFGWQPEI